MRTPVSSTGDDIIVFRSSDGTLFNIHRSNLRCATDGPLAEDFPSSPTEIVHLTEDAKTLELLFAFVYPGAYPPLKELPIEEFSRLAEAAEKYRVAPALAVCIFVIETRALFKDQPSVIMAYAHRHGHEDLLNQAVPYSLSATTVDACKALSLPLFAAWVIYRDARLDAFREQCSDTKRSTGHNLQNNNCQAWPRVVLALEGRVYERGMIIFMDADALFKDVAERVGCDTTHYMGGSATGCVPKLAEWKAQFQEMLSGLPSLSSILSGLNQ
ncbi:hypothetical protein K523DRAFT_316010 [Schizophyllum commune Tattone D]|nr:hypothetical protein K525DRAFT_203518 [Schizophyllum commune Loenen D]KAI5824022.1 hypothetical protein K523DRAFT_316010 [Schizophyllum commune Tattone D]